ncbi:hypothetical protein PVPAM_140055400 [Plasmodium vivax]|nr:hypothetical protein PVPAM_140055400 [Plasmodium vivax]
MGTHLGKKEKESESESKSEKPFIVKRVSLKKRISRAFLFSPLFATPKGKNPKKASNPLPPLKREHFKDSKLPSCSGVAKQNDAHASLATALQAKGQTTIGVAHNQRKRGEQPIRKG